MFAKASTPTLLAVRNNLLRGLDELARHLAAGTAHDIPVGKSSPPIQSGQITRILLERVDSELDRRGVPTGDA